MAIGDSVAEALPEAPGRVAVVLGTRPEAVKLLGVIRGLGEDAFVVHTGQHYSPEMAEEFQGGIGLPAPAIQLEVGGVTRGRQIGEATARIDDLLSGNRFRAVVVQGDTNTALAGALAANAAGLPLVHVEAGLRSYDRAMPEEHNRVVVDHLADLCCAPTETSRANLAAEGICGDDRVVVTGNTVVDAVGWLRPTAAEVDAMLGSRNLRRNDFVLATFHRPENVDDPEVLATIISELVALPVPVVWPLHPRTAARARDAGLGGLLDDLRVEPPAGYATFLGLASACALLISDSGGVQEEASVLKRPVVVVRHSTERPEVIGTFSVLVSPGGRVGAAARERLADVPGLLSRLATISCPYGDGDASAKCVAAIRRRVG